MLITYVTLKGDCYIDIWRKGSLNLIDEMSFNYIVAG